MTFRTILGLLMVLIVYSCSQQISKGIDSGLLIESGPNQGITHIDTLGTKYSYRCFTTTITNDHTIPIHLQISLSSEYDYPVPHSDKQYKVFLLPKELTPNEPVLINTITNGLGNFLNRILDNPYVLNKTLEPHEKCVITIGTLYDNPTDCGIVPKALFVQSDSDNFQTCDSLMNQGQPTNDQLALGVKLDYCDGRCILIPCGQVSFPKD